MPGGPLGVWYNPGHLSPYARMLRCVSAERPDGGRQETEPLDLYGALSGLDALCVGLCVG